MPQLDKLVIISQFFWLLLFFLGLFFILLKDILPKILRIKILRENFFDIYIREFYNDQDKIPASEMLKEDPCQYSFSTTGTFSSIRLPNLNDICRIVLCSEGKFDDNSFYFYDWFKYRLRLVGLSDKFGEDKPVKVTEKLEFVHINRRTKKIVRNNSKLSAWNFYFNVRDSIFHYEEKSKGILKSFITWILSKDVIEKIWLKEVNFYGLNNIASFYTVHFKSYNVGYKISTEL